MAIQGAPFAQGPDFSVERHRDVVVCRVWLRPEISDADAMRMLADKAATLADLSNGDGCKTALILDLRAASSLAGAFPKRRLRGLLKEWNSIESIISIIVGDEVARLKAEEMCASITEIRVVTDLEDALAWAQLGHHLGDDSGVGLGAP